MEGKYEKTERKQENSTTSCPYEEMIEAGSSYASQESCVRFFRTLRAVDFDSLIKF